MMNQKTWGDLHAPSLKLSKCCLLNTQVSKNLLDYKGEQSCHCVSAYVLLL